MAKNYDFKNIERIFAIGGMHGNYKEIFNALKPYLNVKPEDADKPHPKELERMMRKRGRKPDAGGGFATLDMPEPHKISLKKSNSPYNKVIKNSLIVVLGDNGFGTSNEEKTIKYLTDKNKILAYNNVNIVFIRGNNDDPSYFDGEKINFSNIKATPDYSVLETKEKNILCIGGAISADRIWKKEQEKRIGKKIYWGNEAPVFDPELIKTAAETCKHIDYILSHSAPSFLSINCEDTIKDWSEKDESLIKDMEDERLCMDNILACLRQNGCKPAYWGFGHFNSELIEKRSNIVFQSLCRPNINNTINETMSMMLAVDMNKVKAKKLNTKVDFDRAVDELRARIDAANNIPHFNDIERELDDLPVDEEEHFDEVVMNADEEVAELAVQEMPEPNNIFVDNRVVANDALPDMERIANAEGVARYNNDMFNVRVQAVNGNYFQVANADQRYVIDYDGNINAVNNG